jgi:plasmid stabilization system protein ParE
MRIFSTTRFSFSFFFAYSALTAVFKRTHLMPHGQWNPKRERQYEHIKDSLEQRGKSEERAEEIAARTVNKQRAQHGETKTSSADAGKDAPASNRGGRRSRRHTTGTTARQGRKR